MKLDRVAASCLILGSLVLVAACGSGQPPAPAAPRTPVGTTQLTAAELEGTQEAPQVGQPQRASDDKQERMDDNKRAPKRTDTRPGGGFSGYK